MKRRTFITVSLDVEVHSARAFIREARRIAVESGISEEEAREDYSVRNLGDCARMIFDPGMSPPGCSILDSNAREDA